jgi:MFS family permease
MKNDQRLFYGSCFALITTAFSFSIRAGILPELGTELELSAEQLGFINSMWFLGFPISMVIGGLVYHSVGGKAIMNFAFVAHALGILLTIFAGSYEILLVSTLLIGLGNGCTEAACNPMIADAYDGNMMSKMLNRFHMWFPGGIVLGSLISEAMTYVGLGWRAQIWVIMIPTIIYAYMFFGQEWPKAKTAAAASLSSNFMAMLTPLFLFMLGCMALTAISEFGPQQWVELTLAKSGAEPMMVLALVTGTMAVARYFGGEAVHQFNTTGVLLGSAVLATIGVFLFSVVTGPMAYVEKRPQDFPMGVTFYF